MAFPQSLLQCGPISPFPVPSFSARAQVNRPPCSAPRLLASSASSSLKSVSTTLSAFKFKSSTSTPQVNLVSQRRVLSTPRAGLEPERHESPSSRADIELTLVTVVSAFGVALFVQAVSAVFQSASNAVPGATWVAAVRSSLPTILLAVILPLLVSQWIATVFFDQSVEQGAEVEVKKDVENLAEKLNKLGADVKELSTKLDQDFHILSAKMDSDFRDISRKLENAKNRWNVDHDRVILLEERVANL